jgi:hypothetical protein
MIFLFAKATMIGCESILSIYALTIYIPNLFYLVIIEVEGCVYFEIQWSTLYEPVLPAVF